ncbi:MAG: 5'(3')-deoxyribonucleotidase [Bacillota bacterium]
MAETGSGARARPILLCDLDGICADLASKWLEHYNRDWNDNLTLDRITEWEWHRFVKPECGTRIYHYLNRPGFFADLRPIPGAVETLAALSERVEIVVVTASPREAMRDKVQWVRRHLPFVPRENIVITYRKDLVRGDFLFDDAPRNLRNFPGIRIMMDYPYNRDFHDCYRVHSWTEFRQLMERLLDAMAAGERPPASPQHRLPL